MKNFKLFLMLIIGLSILSTSCKKTEEEAAEDILDEILDIKGSINLEAGGSTYTSLFSSVVYSESDKMVSFWAYDLDSNEDSFIVTFGEVPAVGVTGNIDPESDEGLTLILMGSFFDDGGYLATSGTIKRESTDKYELDVVLASMTDATSTIILTGTVVVGENNP